MFKVVEQLSKQEIARFDTFEEASRYCGRIAYTDNYGRCRTWEIDDRYYIDCGPKTFYIEEVIG